MTEQMRPLAPAETTAAVNNMLRRIHDHWQFTGDRTYLVGQPVIWSGNGQRWLVYDADAEGTGILLVLVSPEYCWIVRSVPEDHIRPVRRRK